MAARKKAPPKVDTTGMPVLDARKTLRAQLADALAADYPVDDAEVDARKYDGDEGKARDAVRGAKRGKAVAGLRTAAVLQAWEATGSPGETGTGEPYAVGGVVFQELRPLRDDTGAVIGVEVFLSGGFDPDGNVIPVPEGTEAHYRVVNPPTLVRDGAGDIDVGGRAHREDPLGAVAHAISTVRKGKGPR